MGRPRKGQVVAKEAVVVNVGARPLVYKKRQVVNRKTGELATIDDTDSYPDERNIEDHGDQGVPYAFKAGERVPASHPAVAAAPGHFVPVEEAEDLGLIEA